MFRRILVALDGSAHAQRALKEAIDLAEAGHGTLTLMTVIPEPSTWILGNIYIAQVDLDELRGQIEADYDNMLKAAAKTVPDGMPFTTVLVHGHAGPAIVERLETGQHDLVVMGSRGRGEIGSALLGSVSHHVVQASPVPVLIVHASDPASVGLRHLGAPAAPR